MTEAPVLGQLRADSDTHSSHDFFSPITEGRGALSGKLLRKNDGAFIYRTAA